MKPLCYRTTRSQLPPAEFSTCRRCGAQIRWAATRSGRRMPLDAAPSPVGRFRCEPDANGVLIAWRDDTAPYWRHAIDRYNAHGDTCLST